MTLTALVRDVRLLTLHALGSEDARLRRDAHLVRAEVDVDALVRVLDWTLAWAEREMDWRELKPHERAVVVAAERVDGALKFIAENRERIRARLAA